MPKLIVMRHGKSAWNTQAHNDHARPLKKRGVDSARAVAAALVERGWAPDLILGSDAVRVVETLAHMRVVWPGSVREEQREDLYLGGPHELESARADVANEEGIVLFVGHNPGLETWVERLTGQSVSLRTADAALLAVAPEGTWPYAVSEVIRSREVLASAGAPVAAPA